MRIEPLSLGKTKNPSNYPCRNVRSQGNNKMPNHLIFTLNIIKFREQGINEVGSSKQDLVASFFRHSIKPGQDNVLRLYLKNLVFINQIISIHVFLVTHLIKLSYGCSNLQGFKMGYW